MKVPCLVLIGCHWCFDHLLMFNIRCLFSEICPPDLIQLLLENICLLIVTPTREIVITSLSFIMMFITKFPLTKVGPFVPQIVSRYCNNVR